MTHVHLPHSLAASLLALALATPTLGQVADRGPAGPRLELLNREEVLQRLTELYPQEFRRKGITARVELTLGVDAAGSVRDILVDLTSCMPYYDELARRAAGLMRFAPDTVAHTPLRAVRGAITFDADSARVLLAGDSLLLTLANAPRAPRIFRTPPQLLNRDQVARLLAQYYPASARAAGASGTTLVSVLVDTTGAVRQRRIRRSSGNCDLDVAALRVAAEMRFDPARDEAGPIMIWSQAPIVWHAPR